MPWEDVSTFIPCCDSMRSTLGENGLPYYRVNPKDDGIHVTNRNSGIHDVWSFCPFCGTKTKKEVV